MTVESFFKDPKNAEKKTDELNEIASYSGSAIAHIDWEAKARFIFIDRDGNEILNQLIELDS